jgi:hypothetical protein
MTDKYNAKEKVKEKFQNFNVIKQKWMLVHTFAKLI